MSVEGGRGRDRRESGERGRSRYAKGCGKGERVRMEWEMWREEEVGIAGKVRRGSDGTMKVDVVRGEGVGMEGE